MTDDVRITLSGGVAVPAHVARWLYDAHARGLRFRLAVRPSGPPVLTVSPPALATPEDRGYLATHADAVLAYLLYDAWHLTYGVPH